MHEHEHTLILKKATRHHSLLAPLLQHTLASLCQVSLWVNMDKQLVLPTLLPEQQRTEVRWLHSSLRIVWSARVNSIHKSHTSPANSRRTCPGEDPVPCLGAEAAKGCSCAVQVAGCKPEARWKSGPITLAPWGPLLLVCGSLKFSTTKERHRQTGR